MKNNSIGIFLNNTNSEEKVQINLHNYNILKNNFENIIIVDIDNFFSLKLQKILTNEKNNINIYIKDKNIIFNNILDLNINSIIILFNKYEKELFNDTLEYNYLTFISDKYIYLSDLSDYFKYINDHNLDFYSYTDSTEKEYHYQLYFFSISYNSLNIFREFIINNENNKDIDFELYKIFKNKIPFLKIAYLNINISNNIFYNNKLYKNLLINNLLPIINIEVLFNNRNNSNVIIHTFIPLNFNIDIYRKYDDLIDKNDEFIYNHFLLNGQFENRNYSEDRNCILPTFIRDKLKLFNLLYLFDVPDNFSINKYKENNKDIENLSDIKLYLHWINYGKNENRVFF
jgi:hypothetical protein